MPREILIAPTVVLCNRDADHRRLYQPILSQNFSMSRGCAVVFVQIVGEFAVQER